MRLLKDQDQGILNSLEFTVIEREQNTRRKHCFCTYRYGGVSENVLLIFDIPRHNFVAFNYRDNILGFPEFKTLKELSIAVAYIDSVMKLRRLYA